MSLADTVDFRVKKAMGIKSPDHLEDSELYEYEAIDGEINLFTCSAESVVLTRNDLERMFELLNAGGE